MSVGSLIVPALLSIQNTSTTAQIQAQVYWIVWTLSLFVTISNGIMTLVKVDKKYYVFNTIYHHLMSEGWQYIQLSGKYSETKTNEQSSHTNQYTAFCHSLEKIRMKQIEDEYYKVENNHPTQQSEIVPPTPFRKSMEQVNGFHPTTVQKMGDKTEEYEI